MGEMYVSALLVAHHNHARLVVVADELFEDARHREHGGGIGYVVAAADDLLAVAIVAQTPRLQYARIAERFGIEAQRVDVGYVGEAGAFEESALDGARLFAQTVLRVAQRGAMPCLI